MTNVHKDALFILVKSLSKSEKRQFKLYVGRLGVNTDAKFLALFNLLDKMKAYNEKLILESGIVKKTQLSNLKGRSVNRNASSSSASFMSEGTSGEDVAKLKRELARKAEKRRLAES